MAFPRITPALFLAILSTPGPMGGQLVFDWPIRAEPQPEAVLMGAVSLFWNPGGLVSGPGTLPELWIIHVDGPDATGVGGLAVSSAIELPWEASLGVGYSHLGVSDIPRTTTSPERLPGNIGVSEDVAILGLARDLDGRGGVGASFRIQRGEAAGNVHTSLRADLGVQVRSTLPLNPRFGLTVRDVSGKGSVLGGMELTLPPLASGRLPVRFGYGLGAGGERERAEHRLSLRGSWLGQIHAGLGTTRWSAEDGWTTLWMVGADIGRYSLSVLREELANGFGAVHFYRATIRLPNGSS